MIVSSFYWNDLCSHQISIQMITFGIGWNGTVTSLISSQNVQQLCGTIISFSVRFPVIAWHYQYCSNVMHYCTKFNNYIYVVTCIAKFLQLSAHCGEKEGKKMQQRNTANKTLALSKWLLFRHFIAFSFPTFLCIQTNLCALHHACQKKWATGKHLLLGFHSSYSTASDLIYLGSAADSLCVPAYRNPSPCSFQQCNK